MMAPTRHTRAEPPDMPECITWSCWNDSTRFGVIFCIVTGVAALAVLYWYLDIRHVRQWSDPPTYELEFADSNNRAQESSDQPARPLREISQPQAQPLPLSRETRVRFNLSDESDPPPLPGSGQDPPPSAAHRLTWHWRCANPDPPPSRADPFPPREMLPPRVPSQLVCADSSPGGHLARSESSQVLPMSLTMADIRQNVALNRSGASTSDIETSSHQAQGTSSSASLGAHIWFVVPRPGWRSFAWRLLRPPTSGFVESVHSSDSKETVNGTATLIHQPSAPLNRPSSPPRINRPRTRESGRSSEASANRHQTMALAKLPEPSSQTSSRNFSYPRRERPRRERRPSSRSPSP